MSVFVVDASVVIKWFIAEPNTDAASICSPRQHPPDHRRQPPLQRLGERSRHRAVHPVTLAVAQWGRGTGGIGGIGATPPSNSDDAFSASSAVPRVTTPP